MGGYLPSLADELRVEKMASIMDGSCIIIHFGGERGPGAVNPLFTFLVSSMVCR